MLKQKTNKAFSLVELAIVIVIIGVISASISASGKLMHYAQMKKVVQEFNMWNEAFNSFKFQYNDFPGDLPNAQSYWSTSVDNGDGNNEIQWYTEGYDAWEHLDRADLIPGTFSGTSNGTYDAVANSNVPTSGLHGKLWSAFGSSNDEHGLYLGISTTASSRVAKASVIPRDVYWLDKKYDDGLPASGQITVGGDALTSDDCINNLSADPKTYDLDITSLACNPYFLLN